MSIPLQPQAVPPNLASRVAPARSLANPLAILLLLAILGIQVHDRSTRPSPAPPDHPAPVAPVEPVEPVRPITPVDTHFVAIGRAIGPKIAPGYARAWLAFADALDGGEPLSKALRILSDGWDKERQSITGPLRAEMARLIPPGTPDIAVIPDQRSAASAAARGIAEGLGK